METRVNKEKIFFNGFIFLAALCLVISLCTKWVIPTILALIFALLAQKYYRVWYPKKNRSYKEILQEKKEQDEKEV